MIFANLGGKAPPKLNPQPWLYASQIGPFQAFSGSSQASATSGYCENGIRVGNAFYIIYYDNVTDEFHCAKFNGTTWSKQTSSAIQSGASATVNANYLLWADSSGYLYCSFIIAADVGHLYRSTDSGATWSAVITTSHATDWVSHMTEDDQGGLYASMYALTDEPAVHLYKSSDNGATWDSVSLNATLQRHIHSVYFCPHRKILFVGCGDGGANPAYPGIMYSSDYGTTWTDWTVPQTISMTSDAAYIYFHVEITGDGYGYVADDSGASIFRATDPGETASIVKELGESAYSFAWQAHTNNFGIVAFYFPSRRVICSSDNGNTWLIIQDTSLQSTAFGQGIADTSYYLNYGDDWFCRKNTMFRLYPAGCTFFVDNTNGTDWFPNGTAGYGFKTIPDWGIEGKPCKIKLLGDYAENYTPGTDGLVIDTNGNNFTASTVSGTPIASQDFETGTVDAGDFDIEHTSGTYTYDSSPPGTGNSSTYCLKIARSAESGYVAYTTGVSISSGETAWIECDVYVDLANYAGGADEIISIQNAFELRYAVTTGYLLIRQARSGGRFTSFSDEGYITFPLQTWTNVKVAIYKHATDGYVKIWFDKKLIVFLPGVNTLLDNVWNAVRFGSQLNNTVDTYYDNLFFGKYDPDEPTAYVLNGSRQALIREGIVTA